MDSERTLYFILIFVCLLLSAFFSSAEVSIISLSRIRVKHLLSNDVKFADLLDSFQKQPGIFLSAILLGNTLVNIAAASLGTLIAVSLLGTTMGAVVATICVTLLVLVLGEVIPKTVAAHNAEKMALAYTIPVQLLIWILYPIVWVLNKIGAGFTRMVTDVGEARLTIDEAEIRTAIDDRPVSDVMQPRTEISFIEEGTLLEEFLKIYSEHPHSRFPIYHDTMDNVMGMLTVKDVLMAMAKNEIHEHDPVDRLVRQAYFVPETKRLGEMLAEMRDNNFHMAIVIDEFGGVAGIANLEHMASEIMGSIGDEMSTNEKEITPIDANTNEIDGGLRVEEANDQLDLDLPAGDYDTVAGFILSHLGRIPRQGEHFKYRDLKIAITEIVNRKIERITITREKNAPPAP